MKSYEVRDFDSKKYDFLPDEPSGGSRPRVFVRHKSTNAKFLIKIYKRNPRELWAEVFASKLGKLLGVPVQGAQIKRADGHLEQVLREKYKSIMPKNWDKLIVQIDNIVPSRSNMNLGSQYIKTKKGAHETVALAEVEEALRNSFATTEDLIQDFARMVVFDFIIGNSDRHKDNWAIIIRKHYPKQLSLFGLSKDERQKLASLRHFSTLFDHADSLLYELKEEDVTRLCKANDDELRKYVLSSKVNYLKLNKATSRNKVLEWFFRARGGDEKQCSLLDVISEAYRGKKTKWKESFKVVLRDVLSQANLYEISKILSHMPEEKSLCYNSERKELLLRTTFMRIKLLKELK